MAAHLAEGSAAVALGAIYIPVPAKWRLREVFGLISTATKLLGILFLCFCGFVFYRVFFLPRRTVTVMDALSSCGARHDSCRTGVMLE